jgi:predicted RNase H-like nuclease (RuvC/YqgF family)
MSGKKAREVVALLVVAALLPGCANDQNGQVPMTTQAAGEGAVVGGVAGALACKLGRLTPAQCAAAVVGLAVVGAGVGYSLADHIQERRKQLVGHENDLNARLAYVRGLNADTEAYNAQLKTNIADAQAKINQGNLSAQALEQSRTNLTQQVADANKQLAAGEQQLADMKRFRAQQPPANRTQLDPEIARLESLLAEARSNTNALASLRQRI